MTIETVCGDDVKLVNWLFRQFATEFNTLMCMTFHIKAPWFSEEFLLSFYNSLIDFCLSRSASKIDLLSNGVGSSKSTFLFSVWPECWTNSFRHKLPRITQVDDEGMGIPTQEPFPNFLLSRCSPIVVPTTNLPNKISREVPFWGNNWIFNWVPIFLEVLILVDISIW